MVSPIDIRMLSKDAWLSASFKIAVPEADLEKILHEGFWPAGLRCREWMVNVPRATRPPHEGAQPVLLAVSSDPGATALKRVADEDKAHHG